MALQFIHYKTYDFIKATGQFTTPLEYTEGPYDLDRVVDERVKSDAGYPDGAGWRAPQPYLRDVLRVSDWKGKYLRIISYTSRWSYTEYPTRAPAAMNDVMTVGFPQVSSACITRAEIGCLEKIKDKRVDLALTVLELQEAVKMVESRVVQLFRAYRQTRRGQFERAAKTLGLKQAPKRDKQASKAWLEMQLGWMPLVSDVHQYYELWRDGFRPDGLRLSAVSDKKDSFDKKGSTATSGSYTPPTSWTMDGVMGCRVRLDYTLTNAALSAAAGFGLTNPASIAWDLVPMSFLLDWVVPVGDWLNVVDADYGLAFKGGSRTVYRKLARHHTCKWTGFINGAEHRVDLVGQAISSRAERTVYLATPRPAPPWFNLRFSAGKGVTAIALARAA